MSVVIYLPTSLPTSLPTYLPTYLPPYLPPYLPTYLHSSYSNDLTFYLFDSISTYIFTYIDSASLCGILISIGR